MAEVVFVDTSVLTNLLDVPGKNSDRERLILEFKAAVAVDATFVIPIAAVVEVGSHIAQLSDGRLRRDRASLRASPTFSAHPSTGSRRGSSRRCPGI